MSIDDVTIQLRSQLQEAYGVDGATYLMDRPPGGWSNLLTYEGLDRRLSQFEARLDEKFDLKLGALEDRFDLKLGALEDRFDLKLGALEDRFDLKFGVLEDGLDLKFGVLEDGLDLKLGGLENRFGLEVEGLEYKLTATMEREFRAQTWRLMTAMLSSMAVLVAVMVAAVRL